MIQKNYSFLKEESAEKIVRVLFVTNSYPTAETPGASPCIEQQKKALERLGINIDVLFFDGPKNRLNYLKAMGRIFWLVQIRNLYDLIHAHYGFSGIVARAQFRSPVVVTFRGSDVLSARERPVSKVVAALADRCIVMTEEMRRLLARGNPEVIPYGIDLAVFKPFPQTAARQKLDLPSEIPLILFPYNPNRSEKRFDLVEQAVEIVKSDYPKLKLLVIHDQPHEVVVDYLNACDAMVLASDTEGSPVTIREALACDLPIVSVDVGDVAKVIRNVEGCYISSKSADDIATKLSMVLSVRARTKGHLAAKQFDLSQSATRIAMIYQDLIGMI
jgi:glycosyltransferase involved in cell wall biosynthesis